MYAKISKYLVYIAIVVVIVVSEINYYKLKGILDSNKGVIEMVGMERDLLFDNIMLHYTYNETKLFDVEVVNEDDSQQKLSELFNDDYKLVFRFSYLHCSSCISSIFEELIKLSNDIPKDRFLIIGSYENKRAFLSFKKNHKISYPMYFVKEGTDKNKILEAENMPYFCLLNHDLVVQDLFIPLKEIPLYLKRYLKVIERKYF
ncbi:hypothetical protein [Bacteroides helcogenes]|uniref:Alkyl hydroperoxide reductase subunit C/ Thiol specific antioxidant domain-containing protein n=1 Tax=Bacteroides helcogenes (strain ATCC 35417 / DSM 20613 / JCM 6297 / CCUG 15421 / P 36-108) TaxID=693979 RepID=E6SNG1_BACT6|nr:hypothetical protein [Bacteroides helcogenes]ADV42754.1 hypothetical protein Bache_0732 [Bacteroides helcogenes P 36-108]MDY5239586.1 hypothetical protein [Bacteroides helcogenes]